jgi:hypothetical protein
MARLYVKCRLDPTKKDRPARQTPTGWLCRECRAVVLDEKTPFEKAWEIIKQKTEE